VRRLLEGDLEGLCVDVAATGCNDPRGGSRTPLWSTKTSLDIVQEPRKSAPPGSRYECSQPFQLSRMHPRACCCNRWAAAGSGSFHRLWPGRGVTFCACQCSYGLICLESDITVSEPEKLSEDNACSMASSYLDHIGRGMLKKGRGEGVSFFSNRKNSHNPYHFDLSASPSSHPYPKATGTSSTQPTLKTSFRNLEVLSEQQARAIIVDN